MASQRSKQMTWRRYRVAACLWLAVVFVLADHPYTTLHDLPSTPIVKALLGLVPQLEAGCALRACVHSASLDVTAGLAKILCLQLSVNEASLRPAVEVLGQREVRVNFFRAREAVVERHQRRLGHPLLPGFLAIANANANPTVLAPRKGVLVPFPAEGLFYGSRYSGVWCDIVSSPDLETRLRVDLSPIDEPRDGGRLRLRISRGLASSVSARLNSRRGQAVAFAIGDFPCALVAGGDETWGNMKTGLSLEKWPLAHLDLDTLTVTIVGLEPVDARGLAGLIRYSIEAPRVQWSTPRVLLEIPQMAVAFLLLAVWLTVETILAFSMPDRVARLGFWLASSAWGRLLRIHPETKRRR